MIVFVTGARPNFIKVQPMLDSCDKLNIEYKVFNSNQHDPNMQVFRMGDIKEKHIYSNREGRFVFIMSEFCKFLREGNYASVVIVGDTDTSLACALTADMMEIPVIHVEAGMRSFYKMPEETNRIAIDSLSALRFAPTKYNVELLRQERLDSHLSGNIMIESIIKNFVPRVYKQKYILMEVHRKENDKNLKAITKFAKYSKIPIKWVIHPRYLGLYTNHRNITYLEPQGYDQMLSLVANAVCVITDSGGLQSDASFLGTPLITLRKSTEWVTTIEKGSNLLVPNIEDLDTIYMDWIRDYKKADYSDELWDDKVSERIIKTIITERLI